MWHRLKWIIYEWEVQAPSSVLRRGVGKMRWEATNILMRNPRERSDDELRWKSVKHSTSNNNQLPINQRLLSLALTPPFTRPISWSNSHGFSGTHSGTNRVDVRRSICLFCKLKRERRTLLWWSESRASSRRARDLFIEASASPHFNNIIITSSFFILLYARFCVVKMSILAAWLRIIGVENSRSHREIGQLIIVALLCAWYSRFTFTGSHCWAASCSSFFSVFLLLLLSRARIIAGASERAA
jgi:hypothetical protein